MTKEPKCIIFCSISDQARNYVHKEQLYEAVLETHLSEFNDQALAILNAPGSPRALLLQLLYSIRSERMPGAAVQTDAEIDAYVRRIVGTAMHPTSSCAMGADQDSVVDGQLRVRGIEALRIADASVMPTIVSGNTNAPVIMIAEKAADLISGKTE